MLANTFLTLVYHNVMKEGESAVKVTSDEGQGSPWYPSGCEGWVRVCT
jgi:hypothetical protein